MAQVPVWWFDGSDIDAVSCRNNWLFFGSEEGTRGSLVLMSLVQSCKELGVSPLAYIRDVMMQINQVPASRVHELTPSAYRHNAEAAARAANARRDLAAVVANLKFTPDRRLHGERAVAASRCRCQDSYAPTICSGR